jgi:hypothetical protein
MADPLVLASLEYDNTQRAKESGEESVRSCRSIFEKIQQSFRITTILSCQATEQATSCADKDGLNAQLFKAAELGNTNDVGRLLSIGAEVDAKVIFVMVDVMP